MNARKVLNSVLVLVLLLAGLGGAVMLAQAQGVYERFAGTVTDQQGAPVIGATVTVNGVGAQTISGGSFEIYAARVERYVINVAKSGYALVSQIQNNPYGNANLNLIVKAVEVFQIDASKPNTVKDSRGTQIGLPANALVDSNGKLPTGPVNVVMYTYNLANEPMPGDMGAINSAGVPVYLESAGVFWAEFTDASGKKYNLAPKSSASISVPAIKTDQQNVDLWSYDEAKGIWKQEGAPAKLADGRFQGQVGHFSAWNFDWQKTTPACVKLTIDQAFFDAFKKSPPTPPTLTIWAEAISGSIVRVMKLELGPVGNAVPGPHVLYNLPANATVNFYTAAPPFSPPPYATVNAGAPWGGTGVPPYPYSVCKGQATLTATLPIRNLTVTQTGNGTGTVTSTPAGINCGTDCNEAYFLNTPVTLTAAPASGSTFAGWSGCDSVSGNQCTVTMTADKTVTATFNTTAPGDKYSFGVKFVCGNQRSRELAVSPVVPGLYDTEINILNDNLKPAEIEKRFIVLVRDGKPLGREPDQVSGKPLDKITLKEQSEVTNATMDDCYRIAELVYGQPFPSLEDMPLTIGFVQLISTQDLTVDAVYTSMSAPDPDRPSITFDVERIAGKLLK